MGFRLQNYNFPSNYLHQNQFFCIISHKNGAEKRSMRQIFGIFSIVEQGNLRLCKVSVKFVQAIDFQTVAGDENSNCVKSV